MSYEIRDGHGSVLSTHETLSDAEGTAWLLPAVTHFGEGLDEGEVHSLWDADDGGCSRVGGIFEVEHA